VSDLIKVMPLVCDELGLPYSEKYNEINVCAAHHVYKCFEENLQNDFGYDEDDDDIYVACNLEDNGNHQFLAIQYVGYSIILQREDLDKLKTGLVYAQSFQATKKQDGLVQISVSFVLE